jgi:predicted GNAT family acetyltransferase
VPVTGINRVTSPPDPQAPVIVHEAEASGGRFVLERDGRHLGELAYRRRGEVVVLVHTEVDPSLRGIGAARRLVDRAVEWARADRLRLVPVCRFARGVLEGSPDSRDVLVPPRAIP